MRKFAKIIDETTKFCSVGVGNDTESYKEMGFVEMDVEEAWNGDWYVKGYAPEQVITKEEQRENRALAYREEVDHLMAEYNRKKTFNLFEEGEEEALLIEVEDRVEEIKQRYPYPEGEDEPDSID